MADNRAGLVETVRSFGGDALRDVWVFDEESEHCLFLRDDVAERLDGHDPTEYIDNERYGFITRATYDNLTYAAYEYTVRGFDEFEQFRTFLSDVEGDQFGVLVSFDHGEVDETFGDLYDTLVEAVEGIDYDSLAEA